MRKLILCGLLAAAMTTGAIAQSVIYNPSNTPNTGGGNAWPFSFYTEWRYSWIINKSVLGSTPIKITDLAFATSTTGTWTAAQFQLRMGHTSLSTYAATTPPAFDTVLGGCPIVMIDGPLTWNVTANTWNYLGVTRSAFGWNGTDNICAELRYQSGSANVTIYTDPSINRAYTHTNYSATPYSEPNWFVPIPGEALGGKNAYAVDSNNVLIASNQVQVGGSASIGLFGAQPAAAYQIAASLGQTPLPLTPSCTLYLTPDALFSASAGGSLPGIFSNYAGIVTASGTAGARLNMPAIPALVGICVFHAAATVSGGNIIGCTNTTGTEIVP
jgi:hypothetical protein